MTRFPRGVYEQGEEPDARFSLANERTFLAWIRTGLALLAAGVALQALQVPAQRGFRLAAALVFIALGLLATVQAWFGWRRTELAMRLDRPLPGTPFTLVLTAGVAVGVALVLLGLSW